MSNLTNLINQMTLKEKVGQLNQRLYGWNIYEKIGNKIVLTEYFKEEVSKWGSIGAIYGLFRADPWTTKNYQTGLSKAESLIVIEMIERYIEENTRLNIPILFSEECPHGHLGLDSTTIPTNLTTSCSWDPDLYEQVERLVSSELEELGVHLGLISTLDIMRDPRWGRSEECFGEDSYLASQFAKSAVRGLQGTDEENISIIAVLKHLAGQGNAMGGHNSGPVNIGWRELSEIHLPAVEASIESGAKAFMAAYNDIDGIYCHINEALLQKYLRDKQNFDGIIMADGCALDRIADLYDGDRIKAAAQAIESGIDLSLWDSVYPYLEEAVIEKKITIDILDKAVYRILSLKEQLGLFNSRKNKNKKSVYKLQHKKKLVTELSQESIVLLKNDNGILPLESDAKQRYLITGPYINNIYHQLGDYTPFKKTEDCITILEGIRQKIGKDSKSILYSTIDFTENFDHYVQENMKLAESADVIFITIGGSSARDFTTTFDSNGAALSGANLMTSGENIDLADLTIPENQKLLIKELSKLNKPMIALVIAGRPHVLSDVLSYFSGILWTGYSGQYGGDAIANILFGANPNGRLSFSIPKSSNQLPVYYNYRDTKFKYDYTDLSGQPEFPFGFGLSYTTFSSKVTECKVEKDCIKLNVLTENIGNRSGSETIQIFVKKAQEQIVPRIKELVSFRKIKLNPNEKKITELIVPFDQLTYFSVNHKLKMAESIDLTLEASNHSIYSKKIYLGAKLYGE